MYSESTSNIDESHQYPVKSSVAGRERSERLPSSLIYNHSTNKISDTKQTTPTTGLNRSSKKRITSFSRELSKRPLEVLRKRNSDHKQLLPITEAGQDSLIVREDGVIIEKTVRTLKPSPVHLAAIQPHTPNRCRHTLQLESLQRQADLSSENGISRLAEKSFLEVGSRVNGDSMSRVISGQDTSVQRITTKALTLELDVRPNGSLEIQDRSQSRALTPKQLKTKSFILTPSYNSPRPFSEETNTTSVVTPAIGSNHSLQDNSNTNIPTVPVKHTDSQDNIESRVMSSVSPDFMLVGAHFAGDHLVLVDRGEPIVHQLTDTDSIVNITHTQSDGGYQLEDTESSNVLGKPLSGVRAPPSTATEVTREGVTFIGEDTIAEETDH